MHDVVNDVEVIGAAANDATARAEVGKNTDDDTDDDIECCAAATSDGMLRRASRCAMVKAVKGFIRPFHIVPPIFHLSTDL